ncbi:hypothetical protein M3Y96_00323000 [Aphelenchoides besseyi]|nr:hypothetical protein M3Y96_00323000 [Aphelenchoides besseyi]
MVHFFIRFFLVLVFAVRYSDSAFDPCIHPYFGGFAFDECKEGEISIKWWSNHSLRLRLVPKIKYDVSGFVLNINNYCQLWFEGRTFPTSYAEWKWEDDRVLSECDDFTNCDLKIDTKGVLRRNGLMVPRDPICSHMNVRNPIGSMWSWTKIRLSELPKGWLFVVDVADPQIGEITEYMHTPSCLEKNPKSNGFRFIRCSFGQISLKWLKTSELSAVQIFPPSTTPTAREFQVIINDDCSLYFEGKENEAERFGRWKMSDGQTVLVNCPDIYQCALIIDKDGVVRVWDDELSHIPICDTTAVTRNPIDDEWVWTTLRFVEVPEHWVLATDVPTGQPGEGDEYHPNPLRDKCIHYLPNYDGFSFEDCTNAEVKIEWKKSHELYLVVNYVSFFHKMEPTFKLIINDKCTLYFVGQTQQKSYSEWKTESGEVLSTCQLLYGNCDLKIDVNGVMRRAQNEASQKPHCLRTVLLRNGIDDRWVWTSVRVEHFTEDWELNVFVFNATRGEGFEYIPK